MNILLVAATTLEIRPLLGERFTTENGVIPLGRTPEGTDSVDLLITGIGMVATAWQLGRVIGKTRYDLAVNAGICGSFRQELSPGTLVMVTSDGFPELGAEDGEHFRSIFDLGLENPDDPPFTAGRLIPAPVTLPSHLPPLYPARGITANTIHGSPGSIDKLRTSWNPDVETMEGAAFFYACISAGIPCIQVRAVSNYVETRDKSKWNIPLAVERLNSWLISWLWDVGRET